MEVRINREIRDYSEKLALGLTLREAVFSGLAVVASGGTYFVLSGSLHMEIVSWVCVAAAAPFVFLGFFKYHELSAERIVMKIMEERRGSRCLTFAASDIYAGIKKREKKGNEIKDSKGHRRRAKRRKKGI